MAKGLIEQESLTNIANAIRSKNGKTVKYTPAEMPEAIMDISGLDGFPIGGIAAYGGTVIPDGWLLCDGREVSREIYSELFAVIGTTWGAGDGSTSFNLPDLRNRMPVGSGDDYTLASTGGESSYKLTQKQLPAISLGIDYYQSGDNGKYISANKGNGVYVGTGNSNIIGNGEPINNMPPYAGAYYIIKAKQSAGVIATVVDNLNSQSATDALSANMGRKLNDKFNYTTDEVEIGKWIDDKPIYRKVVKITNTNSFSLNNNMETLIFSSCTIQLSSNNEWRPVPWLSVAGSSYQYADYGGGYYINPDGNWTVHFQVGTVLSSINQGIMIFIYTKK